ncbi:MAG: hypothetical protein JSW70_07940 [Syntrophobacterales bacterium]|nr:MAG: hypothetical protein JSW70_07940 [Syntrophobacterales bacterium]
MPIHHHIPSRKNTKPSHGQKLVAVVGQTRDIGDEAKGYEKIDVVEGIRNLSTPEHVIE